MTLDEVAYRLAASGLGSRNLRPLPPAAARVLVADLLDALPPDHVFDPCRALPGVPARLWQTLETLRLHGLQASSWKTASTDGSFAPQVRASPPRPGRDATEGGHGARGRARGPTARTRSAWQRKWRPRRAGWVTSRP